MLLKARQPTGLCGRLSTIRRVSGRSAASSSSTSKLHRSTSRREDDVAADHEGMMRLACWCLCVAFARVGVCIGVHARM